MIGIYNETRTNWETKTINENVVCFSKRKELLNAEGKPMIKTSHIIAYKDIFGDDDYVTKLLNDIAYNDAYINMKNINTVPIDTSIVFSKKDYDPFITKGGYKTKDIILISIKLNGCRILEFSNENTFILDGYISGGELTLIVSLNNFENNFSIKMLTLRGDIKEYNFGRNVIENKLFVTKGYRDAATDEVKESFKETSFMIKKFRPSRSTYTIVAYEKDLDKLKELVDETKYNIVTINKTNIDAVIEGLKSQNYKAVTLFLNTDDVTSLTKRIYNSAMFKFYKNFNVYYELLNTLKVNKTKIR